MAIIAVVAEALGDYGARIVDGALWLPGKGMTDLDPDFAVDSVQLVGRAMSERHDFYHDPPSLRSMQEAARLCEQSVTQ